MTDSAIYFPFIDVPKDQWLLRALLYWDSVLSIVPYEYVEVPKLHSDDMRDLLAAGLVQPCLPGMYLGSESSFSKVFLSYVKKYLKKNPMMRAWRTDEPLRPVHLEKLGDIGDGLVELELAVRADHSWYLVQPWVAKVFMTYLAAVLGKHPDIEAVPVTDQRQYFSLLEPARWRSVRQQNEARDILLKGVIPRPTLPLTLESILMFKERHADKLRRLRRAVEEESLILGNIAENRSRREASELASRRLKDQVDEVAQAMQVKWGQVVIGSMLSVVSAAGGAVAIPEDRPELAIAAGSGLLSAVYTAIQPFVARRDVYSRPLAYAALAQRRFGA